MEKLRTWVRFEIDLPENAFEKLQASQVRSAALIRSSFFHGSSLAQGTDSVVEFPLIWKQTGTSELN